MSMAKRIKQIAFVALAAVFVFGSLSTAEAAPKERNYLLATASTGGTYYPVGVALSTLIKVKLQPKQKIGMSAINSAGSGENIKLLRDNEVQFAILQGLFGSYAWNGTGPIAKEGPQKNLRSVSMLWQNVEHYAVLKKFAKTGTVADLLDMKGEAMSMGKKNSGTIGSNGVILGNLGIDIDKDYKLIHVGYGPSADALQNGQISGFGIPAGVPASAVTKAVANLGDKMAILDFTDEQLKKLMAASVSGRVMSFLSTATLVRLNRSIQSPSPISWVFELMLMRTLFTRLPRLFMKTCRFLMPFMAQPRLWQSKSPFQGYRCHCIQELSSIIRKSESRFLLT